MVTRLATNHRKAGLRRETYGSWRSGIRGGSGLGNGGGMLARRPPPGNATRSIGPLRGYPVIDGRPGMTARPALATFPAEAPRAARSARTTIRTTEDDAD